jgi:hypothetical protein
VSLAFRRLPGLERWDALAARALPPVVVSGWLWEMEARH